MRLFYVGIMLVMSLVQTTSIFAGPAEERTALEKMLPNFKEAWNSGGPEKMMALCHPDSKMRKFYEKDEESKTKFDREFKEGMKLFGKVESFEIRKYIERKGRYVVRVSYEKKGVVPGTFSTKEDGKNGWLILDFNIDGQGEPELKE